MPVSKVSRGDEPSLARILRVDRVAVVARAVGHELISLR
jgi:hypothetical protein